MFNFFGHYVGAVVLFGINLEHEWIGVGLLFGVVLFGKEKKDKIFWSVLIVGLVLFISDMESMASNLFINTVGIFLSIFIGGVFALLILNLFNKTFKI